MVVVLGSQKGGTGKSTAASNLAVALAARGRDVLLLDADPQHTASRWAARRTEEAQGRPVVNCVQKSGESLIPTIRDLSRRYEIVLVDTGGHDGVEFRSAVMMADHVIIPTRPSQADIETLGHVDEVIAAARAMRTDGGPRAGVLLSIVPTHYQGREHLDAAEFVAAHTDLRVLASKLHDRKVYRDAVIAGLGVSEMGNEAAQFEVECLVDEVFA